MYQNNYETDGNWLSISLEGTVNNKDAFGSIVRCYADDYILVKELSTSGTHVSQHSSRLHFGLGEYTALDSILVMWPGGKIQSVYEVASNQHVHITEDEALYNGTEDETLNTLTLYPNPVEDVLFFGLEQEVQYQIFNIKGQLIQQGKASRVDLRNLESGMYIISHGVNKEKQFYKFIKE